MHILPSQDSVVSQDSVECRTPQCLGQDSAVSQDSVECRTPQCFRTGLHGVQVCVVCRTPRSQKYKLLQLPFLPLEISSSVIEMFTFNKRICYLIDP